MAYQNVVYLLPKVLHEKLAKVARSCTLTAVNSDFRPMEFWERSGGRVHGRLLACLHRVTYSNELRFLYSPMACFAIGAQVITHFSQDRVQQRLHPQRERYTMSATSLSTLVSPSLPCASCRSVDRLEATSFLSAIGVGLLVAVPCGCSQQGR